MYINKTLSESKQIAITTNIEKTCYKKHSNHKILPVIKQATKRLSIEKQQD